jgi:hypothetical protein
MSPRPVRSELRLVVVVLLKGESWELLAICRECSPRANAVASTLCVSFTDSEMLVVRLEVTLSELVEDESECGWFLKMSFRTRFSSLARLISRSTAAHSSWRRRTSSSIDLTYSFFRSLWFLFKAFRLSYAFDQIQFRDLYLCALLTCSLLRLYMTLVSPA